MPKEEKEKNVIEMTSEEFQKAQKEGEVVKIPEPERLQRLVDGVDQAPNPFVDYLVQKFREGRNEFQKVKASVAQLQEKLGELQKRAVQLQGEQSQRIEDIREWWDKPEKEKDDA